MTGLTKRFFRKFPAPWWEGLRRAARRIKAWKYTALDTAGVWWWLLRLGLTYRRRIILVQRMDALGDVICTLPLCEELKRIHPGKTLAFLTTRYCQDIPRLSRVVDGVYGAHDRFFSCPFHLFGLVEKVHRPKMAEEITGEGSRAHIVDELAGSCGIKPTSRQPRLFPSPELIRAVKARYGLDAKPSPDHLLIGINCGPTWAVREWGVEKWQALVDMIHEHYDATIVQFGIHVGGLRNQYDDLTGVRSLVSRLGGAELVAVISACDLVISIDSAPVHIAGAVSTPVIGLFGAIDPSLRLPPESFARAVFSDVPCLFCQHLAVPGHWKTGCPQDIACMKRLDVPTVFETARQVLAGREAPRAVRHEI